MIHFTSTGAIRVHKVLIRLISAVDSLYSFVVIWRFPRVQFVTHFIISLYRQPLSLATEYAHTIIFYQSPPSRENLLGEQI